MAKKKARTPPPPRRVQAPKARTEGRGGGGRRNVWMLGGGVAAVVVVAAAAIFLLAFGGSSGPKAIGAAGCTLREFPAMTHNGKPDQRHLPISQLRHFKYSTFPPTSGPHYFTPAPWNVYDQPVDEFRLVHNLEHGGVVIQYGKDFPRSDLNPLLDWYRKDPNAIVISPLPALGNKIAAAAWSASVNRVTGAVSNEKGHLMECTRFDAKAFDAFASSYGFHGPEPYPRTILTPGT